MTAAKAVEWLTSDKAFGQECYSRKQIAAVIEQQAQEIAKLKAMLDCGVQEMAEADKEIAKKDRMIELACKDHLDYVPCKWCAVKECESCVENWRKWLEKEAEVKA